MILSLKEPDFALSLHLVDNSKLEEVLKIIEAAAYGEVLRFAQGNLSHASKLMKVSRNTFKGRLKRLQADESKASDIKRGRFRSPI